MEEWKKKMWYIIQWSLTQPENETMPSAAIQMDLEITTPREVSQKEKDKYHGIPSMRSRKYDTNKLI